MASSTRPKNYQVEAVRSGNWWAITVPVLNGVFSQAKRLGQVETVAREAIAMMLGLDEAEIGEISVVETPPAYVAELLESLKSSEATATKASAAAAAARREAATLLRDDGLPMRDIGELLGVSHQRISQILAN